ncbi:MAG: fibronectin type III domain-containing protein [Planctomycetota bacterium]
MAACRFGAGRPKPASWWKLAARTFAAVLLCGLTVSSAADDPPRSFLDALRNQSQSEPEQTEPVTSPEAQPEAEPQGEPRGEPQADPESDPATAPEQQADPASGPEADPPTDPEPATAPESAADPHPSWSPPAVYFTYDKNPASRLIVHWHSRPGEPTTSKLWYRQESAGEGDWLEATGASVPMPGGQRLVHTAIVHSLTPDTRYEFKFSPGGDPRVVRTLPVNGNQRPIKFIDAGDIYRDADLMRLAHREAASHHPDFMVLGGDIAGANGEPENFARWEEFLDIYTQEMVTPDGRSVPLVAVIGNHEVSDGGHGKTKDHAPFFYCLFAYPGERGYGVIHLSDYLSLWTLDSGHTNDVDGPQQDWLRDTMSKRAGTTHKMASYHVHMYPAERTFSVGKSAEVRHAWSPIFDEFGLDFGFEHNENTYKRTFPIKDGEVAPTGTIYVGNGGYSEIRSKMPDPPGGWLGGGRWYLAASGYSNHFLLVTLDGPKRTVQAITPAGHVLDSVATIEGMEAPILLHPRWFSLARVFQVALAIVLPAVAFVLWLKLRPRAGKSADLRDTRTPEEKTADFIRQVLDEARIEDARTLGAPPKPSR